MPSSNNCTWTQIKEFQQLSWIFKLKTFINIIKASTQSFSFLRLDTYICYKRTTHAVCLLDNETHTSKSEMEWISVNSQDKNNHFVQVLEALARHMQLL